MISESELYEQVGILVRIAREKVGLNQQDLAKLIGLQRTSITNIEAGKQKFQLHTLFNIANALNIPVKSLLPLDDIVDTEDISRQIQDKSLAPEEQEWIKRIISSEPDDK